MTISSITIIFVSGIIGSCFIANKIIEYKKLIYKKDEFKEWMRDE